MTKLKQHLLARKLKDILRRELALLEEKREVMLSLAKYY